MSNMNQLTNGVISGSAINAQPTTLVGNLYGTQALQHQHNASLIQQAANAYAPQPRAVPVEPPRFEVRVIRVKNGFYIVADQTGYTRSLGDVIPTDHLNVAESVERMKEIVASLFVEHEIRSKMGPEQG